MDCGIGPAGAAIAGLWYLETLNIPTAVANVNSVLPGDGVDFYECGVISAANDLARRAGLKIGQAARDAARLLADFEH